jgi:hypothetical protein
MQKSTDIRTDRISLAPNFFLDEVVSAVTYQKLKVLMTVLQFIRDTTGLSVVVNNWWSGGQFNWRGLRTADTTQGSPGSEHRNFGAFDANIGRMTGQQMFDWVRANAKALYALGVRRVEDPSLTPNWLHLDGKEHGQKGILIILKTGTNGLIPV